MELYNLDGDPFEENNVADLHPDLVDSFAGMMEEARVPSESFNFGRTLNQE
jgi:hypothetical protein